MPGQDQLDINAWLNHREPEDNEGVDSDSGSCRSSSCKFGRFEDLGWRTSVAHCLEAAPSPSTGGRFSRLGYVDEQQCGLGSSGAVTSHEIRAQINQQEKVDVDWIRTKFKLGL